MAIEDMGVRLVVENLSGFLSGMSQVNQTVASSGNHLGSLVSTYEKANRGSSAYATQLQRNMRPALAAVRSLFYTTTSAIMFFMASQENMSSTMRTAMKVISGFSLAMTTVISLYRVWKAQAALAAAAQWVWNGAVGAGTAIAAAFGFTVAGVFWPVTILVGVLAACAAGVYLLWKHWGDLVEIISETPPELKRIETEIENYKNQVQYLSLELENLNLKYDKTQEELKRLQAAYQHTKDTAFGFRENIKRMEADLEKAKDKFEELKDSIANARSELQELTRPRFEGQQEVEDQLFSLEMRIKQLKLEQLRGSDNQWAIDQLQTQYDILLLQSQIKYDPLTRQANEAVEEINGLNEEMAPQDVMDRIAELGSQILADTAAMETYQGQITTITTNLDAVNTVVANTLDQMQEKIDAVTESLYQEQVQIWAVQDALEAANAYLAWLELGRASEEAARGSTWQRFVNGLASFTNQGLSGLSSVMGLAYGGLIKAAHGVLVGERGPEVVSLPAGSMVHPNTYNTSYNITANYTNPQQPQGIALDLEYIRMRSRV